MHETKPGMLVLGLKWNQHNINFVIDILFFTFVLILNNEMTDRDP